MDLRVLLVEASRDDAALVLRSLREAGLEPASRRVSSESELRAALESGAWHVALVDHGLPGFGGPAALRVIAELAPDTPAITVAGAIDEETAVTTLRAGAVDYVLKSHLKRLPPAVERAVAEAELRRDRHHAEDRARASEAMYRRIVELAGEGIRTFDSEHRVTFSNARMAHMLGYEPEETIGRPYTDFIFAEDMADHAAQAAAREQGAPGQYEARFRAKGGNEIWLAVSAVPEIDAEGRYVGAFAMSTDITERKRAQDALRASEQRFEQFADHFPGYLFMLDDERHHIFVNRTEQIDGGVPRREWIGKTPSQVWDGEDAIRTETEVQRALDGEVVDVIEPWMPCGVHQYLHSIYFPIPREGRSPMVGGLSIDVTEQVEAREEVRRQTERLRRTVEGAVLAMSNIGESRDPYTAGHDRRVTELASAIAAEMGLSGETLAGLRLCGIVHDIGKIAVPAEILAKPGRLSDIEFALIKEHPTSGFDILSAIDFVQPVAEVVRQHHERLDGSGYPRALRGDDILPEARVLAVADVVEAMSSHRPYRAALGMAAALAEVREHAGVKYDAEVVATCARLVEEQGFQ